MTSLYYIGANQNVQLVLDGSETAVDVTFGQRVEVPETHSTALLKTLNWTQSDPNTSPAEQTPPEPDQPEQ
jgi:hypothetical protein